MSTTILLEPFRIPHSDIAIYFEDPEDCVHGPRLPSQAVNTVINAGTTRLDTQIQTHGDNPIPLFPHRLVFNGEGLDIVIIAKEDLWHHWPETLHYSDAIDVLRGVRNILRMEGYHAWEAQITDWWVEAVYGTVAVRKTSEKDSA